jgi:hypothetical protein
VLNEQSQAFKEYVVYKQILTKASNIMLDDPKVHWIASTRPLHCSLFDMRGSHCYKG